MINCMKVEVLDLADSYLTRREYAKNVRYLKGMAWCVFGSIVLLCISGIEHDARIQYLEQKLEKMEKKETAG